ncbi:MAG TPA: hypothetical protein VNT99_05750 [Methylomirabilota bacterium]|nr:hypothetical protein [Methylomirabilota bacterium]
MITLLRKFSEVLLATTLVSCSCTAAAQHAGETIYVNQLNLQQVIDAAPSNSVVQCDPNNTVTLSSAVTIRKPLTLVGLRARLPEKLGKTSLLLVESKGVAVTDFELTGNGDSVPQSDRAPLVVIRAGDFRVERGVFLNSSKDGVMIDADEAKEDIVGGVVRDIVGRGVIRDTVSISGSGGNGRKIRNVLVDNVRCYDSRLRGAVEVSDGAENITVRKVYAESAVYALDVQDHNKPGQSNRNVVIEDVFAVRCKHAIRTANTRKGHANLTVRNVTGQQCIIPIQISHTANVHLSNVRILDHDSGKPPIQIFDCRGVSIRDVVVENISVQGPALQLEDCDQALVDGVSLRGQSNSLASAIYFRIATREAFSGLRIANVFARNVTEAGILLETKKDGTLTDYIITGNLATVQDRIKGERAIIANNLP